MSAPAAASGRQRGAMLIAACSNAGRWGPDDQRGTLNLIDTAAVRRGLDAARAGEVVALGRMPSPAPFGRDDARDDATVRLRVFASTPEGRDACDTLAVSPHGFDITHLDAVGHSFFHGLAYNGRRAEQVVRPEGLSFGGIEAMAGGIVTRGVLLDVVASRDGAPPAGGEVSAADLDRAEEASGVAVLPGDAVVVRAGVGPGDAGGRSDGARPGLIADAVAWLHRRQVAVYSGDCIEAMPGEDPEMPMVLHQVGHVAMGLAILDNPDVERLADACRRNGRSTFLLVLAPLPVVGATGCAVNPIAVF